MSLRISSEKVRGLNPAFVSSARAANDSGKAPSVRVKGEELLALREKAEDEGVRALRPAGNLGSSPYACTNF